MNSVYLFSKSVARDLFHAEENTYIEVDSSIVEAEMLVRQC